MSRWMLGGSLLALGAAATLAQAEEAYPDLPVAEWARNTTCAIEDFKGQVTALVFYDDNDS